MSAKASIAIIGGGAAGLVAAIAAAEEADRAGCPIDVHIYEATDKIGRPILASGNGRCNFSNSHIDPSLYWNADFAKACLEHAAVIEGTSSVNPVVDWFVRHGLVFTEESQGRLYPKANKSSSVLDVIMLALERWNVNVHLESKVESIDAVGESSGRSTMHMEDGSFVRADSAILTAGGKNEVRILSPERPKRSAPRPILCPLELDDHARKLSKTLENIRVKCELALIRNGRIVARERGEAMFRKYGISGICAFDLSRFAQKGDMVSMNMFPEHDERSMGSELAARAKMMDGTYGRKITYRDLLTGMVLSRMADLIIAHVGLASCDIASEKGFKLLAKALVSLDLHVEGPADIEHAQVSRGGILPEEIRPESMCVKTAPNLFIAGEAIDVDGPCGGYNLHWAFATGILAGTHAAGRLVS